MKKIVLTIIFALMATQLAFCETASFHVGATIPRMIGVNYFPEQADIGSSSNQLDIIKQMVMREGQKMLLQTSVVR